MNEKKIVLLDEFKWYKFKEYKVASRLLQICKMKYENENHFRIKDKKQKDKF